MVRKSTTSAKKSPKYNITDDTKVRRLFVEGLPRGVDSGDLKSKNIENTIKRFWISRVQNNFAPVFKGKAHELKKNRTLM